MERARRNILAGSATEQQRMDTRTAQPVCFEVFIFFCHLEAEKQDIRKTRTRRACNSKYHATHLFCYRPCC